MEGGGSGGVISTNNSNSGAGGGGGGGFCELSNIIINNDTLAITVGAGGNAITGTVSGNNSSLNGNDGKNSKITFQVATQNNIDVSGGGGGGGRDLGNNVSGSGPGKKGGSGGGGYITAGTTGRANYGTINNSGSGLTVNSSWGKNAPPMSETSTVAATSWKYIGGSGGGAGNLNLYITKQVVNTTPGAYVYVNDGKISTLPGINSLYPNTYFAAGGINGAYSGTSVTTATDSNGNVFHSGYGGGGGGGTSGQYHFTLEAYSYVNYTKNAAPYSGSGGSGIKVGTTAGTTYTSGAGGSGIVMISVLISLISN